MNHAWCSDPARDEAVRAAEDDRHGPLPTLEQCIDTARALMPKSVSASTAPEQENKANGMRTERITLEVTHDLDAPLGMWIVQVIDESLGFDEYVRVVEESAPPAHWLTEEEREAVQWASDAAYDKQHPAEDTLRSIIARSKPPEVVLPVCEFTSLSNYEMGFLEAIGRVKRALAAAGVTVTEANR